MPRRSPETFADYLVIAICPALIVFFVGSLMCFLVVVFYPGEYQMRTAFVVAMFVMAIVCIARIAMEEGWSYASLYAAPLGLAVGYALMRLVPVNPFINWALMGLVWWVANKLTWDCTLIDTWEDVSGQGLLQQMGLEHGNTSIAAPPGTTASPVPTTPEATSGNDNSQPPWWEQFLEPDKRPHAPGVWVIYFSLAALPLFGMGGWFVSDPVSKARVFGLTVIYVASGMGLLLSTSFLGLRRYLRQRKLEMPIEMTSTWILVGIGMIFAMLIVAAILPRPSREYSLSQLPFTVTSTVRRASRFAFGKKGTKDDQATDKSQRTAEGDQEKGDRRQEPGDGKQGAEKNGQGVANDSKGDTQSKQGGERKGSEGKKSASGDSKGDKQSNQRSGEAQSNNQQKKSTPAESREQPQSPPDKGKEPQRESSDQSPRRRPNPAELLSRISSFASQSLGAFMRLLLYGGLLVGGLVAAWIYREELRAAWEKLTEELRELWEKWFGKKKAAYTGDLGPVEPPPRTFASFVDPFASGQAKAMPWPWLVRYTFEALEAWGREHGVPRDPDHTPYEFAAAIAAADPGISANAQMLASWYSQLAYAPQAGAAGSTDPLRELWQSLRTSPASLAAI